jgi:uncharacterized protein YjbJ (UPF0337 family)
MLSQIYRSLVTISFILFFSSVIVFGLPVNTSWAATSFTPIASIERVKAGAKDLEGKTQEAIGKVTGNTKEQAIGRAKQSEADVRSASEDTKEKVSERVKASAKNLEGRTQEAIGKVTGDRKDQVVGKAKQVESKTRNLLEDTKDKVKQLFE